MSHGESKEEGASEWSQEELSGSQSRGEGKQRVEIEGVSIRR